jgi:hypothetical protein
MADLTLEGTRGEDIVQFSVFTANRLGRAHDLIRLFSRNEVHVLAMTVLDTTDSAILRLIVDDPARARALLNEHNFHFTETRVLVVELGAADKLLGALSALLEAEINIHYLYSFLVRPKGKTAVVLSLEDQEVAEVALRQHQYRVLTQRDITR